MSWYDKSASLENTYSTGASILGCHWIKKATTTATPNAPTAQVCSNHATSPNAFHANHKQPSTKNGITINDWLSPNAPLAPKYTIASATGINKPANFSTSSPASLFLSHSNTTAAPAVPVITNLQCEVNIVLATYTTYLKNLFTLSGS